ncbi:hypothetical protein O6H91_11G052400 [Diphasiastrum complanatum]|uniref:Uncharacterized protein n=1 Tax=Diphasiastrum complanatum TaxID=34168 RepID=A0ACC2C932_DIPCM|nr:hypothetical protein O6H91_11G052400 [Diphasiastrum complanatum]
MGLLLLLMGFLSLYLQCASCFTIPGKFASSATLGQQLVSIPPFMNDNGNLTVTYFFESDNYVSLASLKRVQVHRYDINTTDDYCSIDVQFTGVWIWESECTKISKGNNCSVALSKDGDLQVLDGSSVAWSTNTSGKGVQFIELLNSGDLALLDSSNATVWKISDHNFKNVDQVCSAATPGSEGSSASPSMQEPSGPEAAAEGPALASQSSASSLMPAVVAIFLSAASATLFLG